MRCGECGFDGRLDCGTLRDALLARDFEEPVRFWRFHRMAVDAYCLQHGLYVASGKSLAAHLCGLCVAFEHDDDADAMRSIQRWLSTNPKLIRPVIAEFRGRITVGDVAEIEDPAEFGVAVRAWAGSTWEAYRELHGVAREWIGMSQVGARRVR